MQFYCECCVPGCAAKTNCRRGFKDLEALMLESGWTSITIYIRLLRYYQPFDFCPDHAPRVGYINEWIDTVKP